MLDRAKVLPPQVEERRPVELGVAADTVVGVRMQRVAIAVVPDLLGLVLPLNVDSVSKWRSSLPARG